MSNKVALITGSAKGLGKAFARSLLDKGAKVMLSDVDADQGLRTLEEFQKTFHPEQVAFQKCDVTVNNEFESLFDAVKSTFNNKLDIMCNNAGIIHEDQWEKMININLVSMIRGTKLAVEHMSKVKGGNGGVVINLSSAAGLKPVPFSPGYCASKSGILAFSRSMALHPDYLQHGVRINCLCPFYADTDMVKMTDDQLLGIDIAHSALKLVGIVKVDDVVTGFTEMWENESYNGAVMEVNVKGRRMKTFDPTGFEFLTKKS